MFARGENVQPLINWALRDPRRVVVFYLLDGVSWIEPISPWLDAGLKRPIFADVSDVGEFKTNFTREHALHIDQWLREEPTWFETAADLPHKRLQRRAAPTNAGADDPR